MIKNIKKVLKCQLPPPIQITGKLLSLVHVSGSKIVDEVSTNKWYGWSNQPATKRIDIIKDSNRIPNKPCFKLIDSKLQCETLSEDITPSDDFTISIWFKMDSSNNIDLFGSWNKKKVSGYPYTLAIFANNGGYSYTSAGYDFGSGGWCGQQIETNKWVHSAVCRKNGILYFFLNGKLLNSRNWGWSCIFGNYIETDTDGRLSKNKSYDEIVVIKNQALWTENFDHTKINFDYNWNPAKSNIQLDIDTLLPLKDKNEKDFVKIY